MNEEKDVPIKLGEKYMLTIREASIYFNIGVKKIRRLAEDNIGVFSIYLSLIHISEPTRH